MSNKYEECRDCIFREDAIPGVCDVCEGADQYEPDMSDDDDWDDGDDEGFGLTHRFIPILEAA